MKKILALALALIMVLALVPTSFAASTTYVSSNSYTLTADVDIDGTYGSVEVDDYKTTYTAKGKTPEMTITVPYGALNKTSGGGIWDDDSLDIELTLEKFNEKFEELRADDGNMDNFKVYVNGKDQTDNVTLTPADGKLVFKMEITSSSYTTYAYQVTVEHKDGNGNITSETVNFSVTFKDDTKSKYDLKFIDSKQATLSDGIWYMDTSRGSNFNWDNNMWNPQTTSLRDGRDEIQFTITRNDGSKFTTKSYWAFDILNEKYPAADRNKPVNTDKSTITLTDLWDEGIREENKTYEVYVTVEDKNGIYRGIVKVKYRNNVWRTDPKGVYFAQREYTIGVNEVLTPTYTTIVPTYHKLADYITLAQTANTEKSIFDVDGGKIIGKAEGVGYVYLTYNDRDYDGTGRSCTYTDTIKIIVKGKYQVVPESNYVVTASSLNVRSGAGTSYKIVGSLKKGAVAKVVEIKDGWAKIVTDKFTNQYVSAQYLQLQASGGSTPSTGTKTVIARVLNVRSGAGTGFAIVGKLNRGATVVVEEIVANGNWAKIKYNNGTAYVHTAYLK